MKKTLGLLGLFLGLVACGPVIETHYDFVPPKSGAGMKCIANCQDQQSFCQADAQQTREKCRRTAERKVERDYERKRNDYISALKLHAKDPAKFPEPKEPRRASPSYWECDKQGDACTPGFHMCYRACGGAITERQVCVQNCEQ